MVKINLDKNKKYLLACSYGPDSMALFDLLNKGMYNFAVAHVNYGLRKEAEKETKDLIKYCEQNNVQIFTHFNEEIISKNIEEKCRDIRYTFFRKILEKEHFDAVLVAHNEDDNLETYFLQRKRRNIVEYFGLKNVAKIQGYEVIRPLLSYPKKELEFYDKENNVPFAIDSSNLEDIFERNKIRHWIVQKLSEKQRADIILEIEKKNEKLVERHKAILLESPTSINALLTYSDEELAYFFTTVARRLVPEIELSLRRIKEFRKVMESDKPNVIIKLKQDTYFVKSYDKAQIKALPLGTSFYYVIEKPSAFDCEYFALDFTKESKNRNVKFDDYPIVIRNASKKDEMIIKNYSTSLRRQFINWKMPKELRERWPIILNCKNEIIYVPKYDPNFKADSSANFYVKI